MSELPSLIYKKEDKNFSILSKFLSKITPKEKDTNKSFHQQIDLSKNNVFSFFSFHPYFSDLVKYNEKPVKNITNSKFKKRKKQGLLFTKITRGASFCGTVERTNEIRKKTRQLENLKEKNDKLIKNNSATNILNENSNYNKWFEKLNEENPLKLLLVKGPKDEGLNTTKEDNTNVQKLTTQSSKKELKINKIHFIQLLQREIKKKNSLKKILADPKHRLEKFKCLLEKCDQEIGQGNSIDAFIEKNNNELNNKLSSITSMKTKLNENQELTLLQKLKSKTTKYDRLHEKSLKRIKKNLYFKVSADMAYSNRKEYIESIKNPNRDEPYEIFLKELNEITFAQEKKKEKEKLGISQIENILDDTIKEKEYLKNKIEQQQLKYSEADLSNKKVEYYPLDNEFFVQKKLSKKKNYRCQNNHVSFERIALQVFEDLEKKQIFVK